MLGEVKTIATTQAELIRNVRLAPLDRVALLVPTVAQELVVAVGVKAEKVPGVVVAVVEKTIRRPPLYFIQFFDYTRCMFSEIVTNHPLTSS